MNSARESGGPAGRFFLLAGAAVLAWIIFQIGGQTGHVLSATRFILGDPGSYLYAVGCAQAGETLYRDFAWQYGPLALGWYRAFAAVGGNTPLTLVLAGAGAFAAAWMLVARLAVRFAGWRWGGGLALVILLPVMSASGPSLLNGAHGAIEMLLLAGCAWTLAGDGKARWRPWQLGLLLGLLHWVRFGPQVAALAAILLITAWQHWPAASDGRVFVRSMSAFSGSLLAAYALTIAPLVIWIFRALPPEGARAQLWPVHMVAHYAATYPNRWPHISSAEEMVTVWLPALLGVGLVLHRLAADPPTNGRDLPRSGPVAGLLFLPLHYLFCCVLLFRNDNPIIGHLWLTGPGLALAAGLTSKIKRGTIVLLLVPAVGAIFAHHRELVREEQAWQARPLTLPNGQQLWFHADEMRRFQELQAALGPAPQALRLTVFLAGGGIHHFFGPQRSGRHWWYLPEFVRPDEEEVVLAALLQSDRILVADRGQLAAATRETPGPTVLWLPLSGPLAQRLQPHLRDPRHLEGVGVLLQVQP